MLDYNISNFFSELTNLYGLNIISFLKNKTLNFNNYLFFVIFLLLRLIVLFFLSYELSILNIVLMLIQSIFLLGTGYILYSMGPLGIILIIHCIIIYVINLFFHSIYDY